MLSILRKRVISKIEELLLEKNKKIFSKEYFKLLIIRHIEEESVSKNSIWITSFLRELMNEQLLSERSPMLSRHKAIKLLSWTVWIKENDLKNKWQEELVIKENDVLTLVRKIMFQFAFSSSFPNNIKYVA